MASTREIVFSVLLFGAMLSSCVPDSVRDAQHVVAQADSLWREGKMYGVDAGDSATLAQAYHTLSSSIILPSLQGGDGGRLLSCYHYGRLLRAKDNPVEAMQVFIDATHTRTRDYHILGRVYSNMGSICHLAGEFPLSYDMYERSADMFLQNGDTLNYYYALNDMAFELAMQGKEEETFALLSQIDGSCTDAEVLEKVLETKAKLYEVLEQYDKVIAMTSQVSMWSNTTCVLKARAFENLEQFDSALYYAQKVQSCSSATAQEIYNVLYILINYDSSLSNEDLITLSAQRSDIETDILTPLHNQWALSVQLLEQDLNRKPDFQWLYAIAITLAIVGVIIVAYVRYTHKKRKLLSLQIEGLTIQNKEAEAQHANLTKEIDTLSQLHDAHRKEIVSDIERFCALIRFNQDLHEHLHWNNFAEMCTLSDRYLYNIVTRLKPYNLSQKEIRLCILVLLKASANQMVDMIPYAQSGLGKFKYTTANKLGTTTSNLRPFLLNLLG